MEKQNYLTTLAGVYLIGLLGYAIPFTRPLMKYVTAPVLVLTMAFILWTLKKELSTKTIMWLSGAYILTFVIEVIGVKTGLVFGSYTYGSVLGPKLLETPLLIGLLWIFVVWGAYQYISTHLKNKGGVILLTGVLAVVFDLFLEYSAIALGYWSWSAVTVPLQNYIAWGIIGSLLALSLHLFNIDVKHKIISYFFIVQLVFFALLRVVL